MANPSRPGAPGRVLRASIILLFLQSGGCIGNIGDRAGDGEPSGGNAPDGAHPGLDVSSAPIRRMTPAQYVNTVRDLLGDPELELDLDDDIGAAFTLLGAQKLNAAADYVASRSDVYKDTLFPCDTSGEGSDACVDEFIATFGRRALRRPLEEEDKTWLRAVFDQARAEQSFHDSLLIVLQVILQSPQFIYFLELGGDGTGLPDGLRPLTSWERATRLSYFLWNSTPDDELLAAAESGSLDTLDGVAAEAKRLLASPRVRETVKDFFVDWLKLEGSATQPSLTEVNKNVELYPQDSPALRAAMREEIEALVERVLFEQEGTVETLLTTTDAYVNGPLAALYGVTGPTDEATYEWVSLPADQRAGLFTRAGFLALYAGASVKSPIRRGAHVLKETLCFELGKPPPNANDTPVEGGNVDGVRKTVRQDVEGKTSGGVCSGCHQIINPLGFTFEHYGALGEWQEKETGQDADGTYSLDIDATGSLPEFSEDGASGPAKVIVDGGVEMSKALAETPGLAACMAQRWFTAALHRDAEDKDDTTIEVLRVSFRQGATLPEVVTTMVRSDAFLFLRPSEDL